MMSSAPTIDATTDPPTRPARTSSTSASPRYNRSAKGRVRTARYEVSPKGMLSRDQRALNCLRRRIGQLDDEIRELMEHRAT